MNCRAAPVRSAPLSPVQALDRIDNLLGYVLRRQDDGASKAEVMARVLEAQQIAILGSAYERRRARETINEGVNR